MRTIYLQTNTAGQWFVRCATPGNKIFAEESFSTPSNAQRAFMTEGRNQPHAAMVVIVEGKKPLTVRAGSALPPIDRAAEDAQLAKVRSAMRHTRTPATN